jgi:hypothetical protein
MSDDTINRITLTYTAGSLSALEKTLRARLNPETVSIQPEKERGARQPHKRLP